MADGQNKSVVEGVSQVIQDGEALRLREAGNHCNDNSSEVMKDVSGVMDNTVADKTMKKALKRQERKKRLVSKLKITWALVNCLISTADVVVVIVLSYLHYIHEHDIIAWLMLLPILFNFVGVFTFLSNDKERKELELLAGSGRYSGLIKNLMVFPVVGIPFSAARLVTYAFEEDDAEKFERLESLLTKMKQYESFFRAAPEAFIQMTYRIVSWEEGAKPFEFEDYWTVACIGLSIFAVGEAHMYGVIRPYYRMFMDASKLPEDAWDIETIPLKWRVVLFVFTCGCVASRLCVDALWRAAANFIFTSLSFGEIIAITLLGQFLIRSLIHAFLLRKREDWALRKGIFSPGVHAVDSDTLVYRAVTYAWRSIFMSFDFQSSDRFFQGWFYVENLLMLFSAYIGIYIVEFDLADKSVFFGYTFVGIGAMITSIIIRVVVRYCMRKKHKSRGNDEP